MKRSVLPTCILGICVLQGFLGFTTISYADVTLYVGGSGGYESITGAVAEAADILATQPQHVTIQVQDGGPYYESVYIMNIPTWPVATLTLVGAPRPCRAQPLRGAGSALPGRAGLGRRGAGRAGRNHDLRT